MKISTSYRISDEIKRAIVKYGGSSYLEGCVLLNHLRREHSLSLRIALDYELLGFPSLDEIRLLLPEERDKVGTRTTYIGLKEPLDYEKMLDTIISTVDDPRVSDLPTEMRPAVASIVRAFCERPDSPF